MFFGGPEPEKCILDKKLGISSHNMNFMKKHFSRKKWKFREKAENYPKCYLFCFKKLLRNSAFANSGAILPEIAKFSEIH